MKTFFRFVRNILIIAVLAFGIHTYQHNENFRTATDDSITTLGQRVHQILSTGKITPPKLSDNLITEPNRQKQIKKSINAETGKKTKYRYWNKPNATVYIDMPNNPSLRSASVDALNAWNRTGAFTFHQVDDEKNAQIVMSVVDESDSSAAGETTTTYNPVTGHLLRAEVHLNRFYLQNSWYGYDNNRIINTAEHELGHAIGLNHTNGISVMYPKGSLYTIQPQDIRAVKRIYNEK